MKKSWESEWVVVKPQAMWALWPRMVKGTPGAVAPARSAAGVVSRARYQTPGVDIQRWGSLARRGAPL